MITTSLSDDLRSFRRSWVHHTGMQLATLTVLTATFAVVTFVLSLSLNLKHAIATWGDGVQLTAYLKEEASDKSVSDLKTEISSWSEVADITYVPRETATLNFKTQMASYTPDLLSDADFANPFPASLRISIKGGVQTEQDLKTLEGLAVRLGKNANIEDVSYGQSWIKNYSAFVSAISGAGGVLSLILLLGGLFVVGNSIRTSISARREEIEILELVGATSNMIRRPYVAEGLFMGLIAAALAIVFNYGLHLWEKQALSSSFALARMAEMVSFLGFGLILLFIASGGLLGAFGAWLTVRKINDGWSASQRSEG